MEYFSGNRHKQLTKENICEQKYKDSKKAFSLLVVVVVALLVCLKSLVRMSYLFFHDLVVLFRCRQFGFHICQRSGALGELKGIHEHNKGFC